MSGLRTVVIGLGMLGAVLLVGCVAPLVPEMLTVNLGAPVHYTAPNGDHFVAQYGSLSDETLHFVRVKMPSGVEYTLPQVLSASGIRYTDDRELVWWTHQGTVTVEMRNADGTWETKYAGMRESSMGVDRSP